MPSFKDSRYSGLRLIKVYRPFNNIRMSQELQQTKPDETSFCMELLQRDSERLPRDDYHELLELSLIFLRSCSPRGIHFQMSGAFHHARLMSKVLHVLKMYVFRQKID